MGGQRHAPAALPPGKTRYPLYRRLGGPQNRSGQVLETSPSPGFDPRTVQLVASRYTDYAIPAPRSASSGTKMRKGSRMGIVKCDMPMDIVIINLVRI